MFLLKGFKGFFKGCLRLFKGLLKASFKGFKGFLKIEAFSFVMVPILLKASLRVPILFSKALLRENDRGR